MKKSIKFYLNNDLVEVRVHPIKRLIDVLREDCGLIGVKEGCGEGECGACTAFIDSELVNTCIFPIDKVENKHVMTIEGFRNTAKYKILKESFEKAGAVQCGFCSPGMIMAAENLLREYPYPTEQQIRVGISGNLCRCTGYNMIVEAIALASKRGDGLW